ncbi:hypothetical protein ATANTOWER_026722 [Ataeniobius toweri]|uniref:Uncharacterized protein n=1 Tax=Ataeniobius toweri TaxID=208326 RepID=A0ABU7AZX0_9TELE|nr:hypothetical protein [Ataeniobius toweri]
MQFVFSQETNRFVDFPCSTDLAQSGLSWSNPRLLIPEPCLKESGNPETRRLQTHGSCSLPPSPSSQGEPSNPTQRSIHLPVHPPSFASSRNRVFSPRKKGQFSKITGTSRLTACQPQMLWGRTYSPTSLPSLSLCKSI